MITTSSKYIDTLEWHALTGRSPFSQKNIQECRCGTESCRGVLGPKPKKPVEERSIASALIAGAKRKLHDFLGSGRAWSESNAGSPKKRKVNTGNAVTTKAKNSNAATRAAREQAEVEAAEHSRQIASREDRAMKRGTSMKVSKRLRPGVVRRTVQGTLKSTRTTTVSLQRKVVKPGALKAVNKSARTQVAPRRASAAPNGRRGLAPSKRPSTPESESHLEDDDSDEDASPNITPASLRSASKDGRKRIFNFDSDSQATPPRSTANRGGSRRADTSVYKARSAPQKSAPASRGLHSTGAGVSKAYHPAQSRARTMRGR
jgi:palmitoyltransferase ZDHHC9/14/18